MPDDWRAGDRIVIASTDRDPSHAELVTIASIADVSMTLTAPLRFAHWGVMQTIAGRQVDERAEVGMLTRNVVIRGDSATSATGFGGHVMVMAGGVAHVEGVGLYYMGQLGLLARYPMHWHLAGDVSGQYIRNTSVWHSFNRCVTVHGSHAATVENNVCFDHVGHGYFLEDGIETRNTIVGNLGLGTHTDGESPVPLASDRRPATFWITNPDNTVRNNVAAGSQQFGFWYAMPEHPTGFSATDAVTPNVLPVREFAGNVSHSNETGLYVDERALPDGNMTSSGYYPGGMSSDVTGDFQDVRIYKTSRGVWTRGRVRLIRPVLTDNVIGATLSEGPGQIIDPFVVGETQNVEPTPNGEALRGFQFYDGPSTLRGGTFVNFHSTASRPAGALSFLHYNWAPLSAAHTAEGVRFVDANTIYADTPTKDGDKAAMFTDRDGSVTGMPGAVVAANNAMLLSPGCVLNERWNGYVCPGARMTGALIYSSVATDKFTPVTLRRDDGASERLDGTSPRHIWPTFPVNHEYTLDWSGQVNEAAIGMSQLRPGEWVTVSLPWTLPNAYVILNGHAPMASSVDALRAATVTTGFYDVNAQRIYVKLWGTEAGSAQVWVEPHP